MFCSKCGAKNDDHSKFCYQCGSLLEEAVSVTDQPQESAGHTYVEPQVPISNNTYIQPEAAEHQDAFNQPQSPSYYQQTPYQQGQGNNQSQSAMYQQPYPPYQQMPVYGQPVRQGMSPKSKKTLFLSLAGVAAAAIIILCVTFLSPSNSGRVLDNILSAAKGTTEAKSVEFTVDLTEGRSRDKANGVIVYDLDKGKIEFDIETGNGSRSILYDGTMYEINSSDEVRWSEDYSSEIDNLLEYYDEFKDGMDGLSKIDWEDAIDEAGLSRYVDTDKMAKCLKEFEKNLNSKSYFEKVCEEFSVEKTKDGTKYTFDVDVPKLIESMIDTFEPVIDMDIDDIKDEILDQVDVFDKLLVEITIKADKLVEIHADVSMEDWYGDMEQSEVTIKLKNYGKASLDEDEIEDVIDNVYYYD